MSSKEGRKEEEELLTQESLFQAYEGMMMMGLSKLIIGHQYCHTHM